MSNQSIQTVTTSGDKLKVTLAIVAAIAGIVAFYVLVGQPKYVRLGALVGGVVIAAVLILISQLGRDLIAFAKESVREAKKVVWPTRKETGQMTAVVFGFVLITESVSRSSDESITDCTFFRTRNIFVLTIRHSELLMYNLYIHNNLTTNKIVSKLIPSLHYYWIEVCHLDM